MPARFGFSPLVLFLCTLTLGCALAGWAAGLRSAAGAKSDPLERSTQYLGFWGENKPERANTWPAARPG